MMKSHQKSKRRPPKVIVRLPKKGKIPRNLIRQAVKQVVSARLAASKDKGNGSTSEHDI